MEQAFETLQAMKTSHKILMVLFILLITNFITFMMSTSFQKQARFDDDFDYHIYDSQDYEHSYSYTGYQDLGDYSSAVES